ncbi:DUF2141 domain-containing protein [Castellaniella sp. GW247-6E4]|uniref:DUF2141 domain-containing protein n=1 Tax=Castellaniella sp. GW247-6E4 TaxID=3140380 RepID=UPI003315AED2
MNSRFSSIPLPRTFARLLLAAALAWLSSAHAADLHVEVTGIRSTEGVMAIVVFAAPGAGFPFKDNLAIHRTRVPIDEASGQCATTIQGLPAGEFAVAIYHDTNDSGALETGLLGRPKKPYGYSNNPKPLARAARFEEARFELPRQGATITIELQ